MPVADLSVAQAAFFFWLFYLYLRRDKFLHDLQPPTYLRAFIHIADELDDDEYTEREAEVSPWT